jgi:hypothetical protein
LYEFIDIRDGSLEYGPTSINSTIYVVAPNGKRSRVPVRATLCGGVALELLVFETPHPVSSRSARNAARKREYIFRGRGSTLG